MYRNFDRAHRVVRAGLFSASFALAGMSLASPAAWAIDVDVAITADNAYGFGWGTGAGMSNYFGGVENTTSGQIFFCPPSVGGAENYTISGALINDYLYIVAWSDDAVTQGVLGQFKSAPNPTVYTGVGDWEVCATGIDFDVPSGGGPLLNGAPGSNAINAQIAVCNANAGNPLTSSVGWVGLSGGTSGNLAFGEDNTSGGDFPPMSCIDTAAHWMWFNANPAGILNPFDTNPPTGGGHKEYLIFRLGVRAVTSCGNGTAESGEECDDGNLDDGDGCTRFCTICGNGVVSTPEECDDGNLIDGDGCSSECIACGNNIVTPPEECDDGNLADGDGCDSACMLPCGNGVLDGGEACDDGNNTNGDGCDSNCTPTSCGNGIVTAGEDCDDGNLVDGDGCSSTCMLETPCGDGQVDLGEQCDPPGPETCNNMTDDDGDNLIDCADTIDCPPGVTTCDGACQLVAACEVPSVDPGWIRFGADGELDRLTVHARFEPQTGVDFAHEITSLQITNPNGVVYRGSILGGDLEERRAGSAYRFRDRAAKSGTGIHDGISKLTIRRKGGHISFHLTAYADLSAATRPDMTTHFLVGQDGMSQSAEWKPVGTGWRLKSFATH